MRHVVLHYHLFKNAGSSVDAMLHAAFGDRWGTLEGQHPWEVLPQEAVLAHVLDHPRLLALSSHQARLPVPAHPMITFWPIVFLRHPIDRVGSVYAFERANPNSPSLGANAAQGTLADYVRWRLRNGSVIRNFQTTHLSGRCTDMRTAVATPDDLARAVRRLDTLPVVGVVERFAGSIKRFREVLTCELRDVTPVNSSGRAPLLVDRLALIRAELGPLLHQELVQANRLDLALYDHATRCVSSVSPAVVDSGAA